MSGTAETSGTTTETTDEATVKIEVTDEEPKEGEGTDETGAPGADPDVEAGPPDGEGEAPMPERKRTPQQIAAEQRLKHTQKQVDEVVDIMKTNVEKVLERDSKLAELDYRSDKLQEGASMFEKQAGALKNKFWLENMKMMIVMGIMGLIVVVIIYYKYFAE